LKFGMAMFENGSCPLVSYFSAIVLHDTFAVFTRTDAFLYQLKSLGPAHFVHPLRRSNSKPTAVEEVVHSSENKEEMAGTQMTQPARLRRRWSPRSGAVARNLVVVVGNLLIPAVSKLNAGRS
jgi:hypothetical protein